MKDLPLSTMASCTECTPDIPCLRHVVAYSDRILNSPEAQAQFIGEIHEEIDMAGPSDTYDHRMTAEEPTARDGATSEPRRTTPRDRHAARPAGGIVCIDGEIWTARIK